MTRLITMVLAAAILAPAATGASAQGSVNPLLGSWELNAEDGYVRYEGKIKCSVVAMRFDADTKAYAAGTTDSPDFSSPSSVVYILGAKRVRVVDSPSGAGVDYFFVSPNEIGIDNITNCKYRRVGSNEPSLAEHEALQAAQAAAAGFPVPAAAPPPPTLVQAPQPDSDAPQISVTPVVGRVGQRFTVNCSALPTGGGVGDAIIAVPAGSPPTQQPTFALGLRQGIQMDYVANCQGPNNGGTLLLGPLPAGRWEFRWQTTLYTTDNNRSETKATAEVLVR